MCERVVSLINKQIVDPLTDTFLLGEKPDPKTVAGSVITAVGGLGQKAIHIVSGGVDRLLDAQESVERELGIKDP